MACKFPCDESELSHFSFGRGRGVMGINVQPSRSVGRDVGASPVLTARDRDLRSSQDLGESPMGQGPQDGPHHSTPSGENTTLHQFSDMIYQLGSQIGESIVASLLSSGAIGGANHSSANLHNAEYQNTHTGNMNTLNDNSHVRVVVKSDKEPVIFRGDKTDKYTVTEWVELMKSYLNKQNYGVQSQIEVVMGRLMGKARDVVKIGFRSDPLLETSCTPDVIYNILKQYFSDTSSCLPLQDFYSTLPSQRENPIDYWIRLNKAADLAEEGLQRQGRQAENMGGEIAKMFVKHCPDPELASVFKYKQIHEWTSKEIQQRIDEYHRERVSAVKVCTTQTRAAALLCQEMHTEPYSVGNMETSSGNYLSYPALSLGVMPSLSPSPVLSQAQQQPFSPGHQGQQPYSSPLSQNRQQTLSSLPQYQRQPPSSVPQGQLPPSQQQGSDATLGEMMSMLRELLTKVQVGEGRPTWRRGGRQVRTRTHFNRETNCQVCNGRDHTTEVHCRSDRLCFTCFKPGHSRHSCPSGASGRDVGQGN